MRHFLSAALLISTLLLAQLALATPININAATATELDSSLQGIGEKRAQRIVEYRERHGPFATPEDIMSVPYIGRRIFEANRQDIRVN